MVEINCDLSAKTLLLGVPFPRLLTGTTDSILSSITAQNLYHTLENVLYTCVNLLELTRKNDVVKNSCHFERYKYLSLDRNDHFTVLRSTTKKSTAENGQFPSHLFLE